jgi:hypothetical protein
MYSQTVDGLSIVFDRVINQTAQKSSDIMKKTLFLVLLLLFGSSGVLCAADIGASLPLENKVSVDGWGGVQVRFGETLPPGEVVTVVQYYADDDRAGPIENEEFRFVPLVVQQEGGSFDGDGTFTIYDVGQVQIPILAGEQLFPWGGGSLPIPDDGNLYHVGLLEWPQDAANNAAGGLVSFGTGGTGMHFFDVDTSVYTPDDIGEIEPGLNLSENNLQIHTSGAAGRDYQVNFTTGTDVGPPPGDFNEDGTIDLADFNILATNYNMDAERGSNGDINFSGHVDFKDFVAFRSKFEEGGGAAGAASVPEPMAGMLGVLALISTLHFARRRRRMM